MKGFWEAADEGRERASYIGGSGYNIRRECQCRQNDWRRRELDDSAVF